MYTENIELLKDEAQRLLQLEMDLLEQMMAAKGVITEAETGIQQTFDRTSTLKHIEVLKGEHTKLENMELVIAVVGTMKAGKSTTINAIVGSEILPNRNRAMTSLPTLIRHTPGQIEPILTFENNDPINALCKSLHKRIEIDQVSNELEKLAGDEDMKELIDNIRMEKMFDEKYQGADAIFWFLKTLNDLVRLSSVLDADFPFSAYSNISQMPVIEVEFAHLREEGKNHGRLTLLDTPGPNEAGQSHLRDMLKEQLKKTSAVLAIFDYTQLNSDADEDVREKIKNIAKLHTGRLFALVNKFDQKDRNGDGKEAIQTRIADQFMDGLIEARQVFPVSSNWGYLANRAKHEIVMHQALPNPNQEPWVDDFANAAFGSAWEENDIKNKDEVLKKADALWKKSGFHDPMENVIRTAHAQAVMLSLDSAAKKLVYYTNTTENFIGSRCGALNRSAESLQKRIADLKSDIEKTESLEKGIQYNIELIFKDLKSQTKQTVTNSKKNIVKKLGEYFKEGKRAEKEENLIKQREEKIEKTPDMPFSQLSDLWRGLLDFGTSHSENNRDFNPDDKTIICSSEGKANELVERIKKSVEDEIEDQRGGLDCNIDSALEKFHTDFSEIVKSAEMIISHINSDMVNDGFKINLIMPSIHSLNAVFIQNNITLADKIDRQTKIETYRSRKADSWAITKWWDEVATLNRTHNLK